MALSSELRNLRKYLLAARRELDALRATEPDFRMDLDGLTNSLNSAWVWCEEYTWTVENKPGTSVVDSEQDSHPTGEAGDVSIGGGGTERWFSM